MKAVTEIEKKEENAKVISTAMIANINVWRSTKRTMNARDGQWSPVEATWMERVDKHENIFM